MTNLTDSTSAPSGSILELKPISRAANPKGGSGIWVRRVSLLALIGAIVTCVAWFGPRLVSSSSSDRPLTARVQRGELRVTVTDRGELESTESVQVLCELQGGGKITSIISEGSRVKKGDEVCKLDTDALTKTITEQEVRWETAVGKLKAAKSDLSQAKNKRETEISKAKLTLDLSKIDLEAYESPQGKYVKDSEDKKSKIELSKRNLKEAEQELQFTKDLVRKGLAPLEQVRQNELRVEEHRYAVTSAEADLYILANFERKKQVTDLKAKASDNARELIRTTESQDAAIDKAKGDLTSAEKTETIELRQLERLKQQMERCTIKAPSDGIVVYSNSRWWDDSSRVRPGAQVYYQQQIFSLPDLSKMRAKMKVHEAMIKKVAKNQSATMTMEALPGKTLNGKVMKIATMAQNDRGNGGGVKQYETEVSIDDLPIDAGLKPGMSTEVKILINVIPDALSVPVQSVAEQDGQHVAYVVTGFGVEKREVKVGDSNETQIQVLSGVSEGEEVTLDARSRAAAEMKANSAKEKSDGKKSEPTQKQGNSASQAIARK